MSWRSRLTADDHRFLAALPVAERRVIEEFMALHDARFVDERFAAEFEDVRPVTDQPS